MDHQGDHWRCINPDCLEKVADDGEDAPEPADTVTLPPAPVDTVLGLFRDDDDPDPATLRLELAKPRSGRLVQPGPWPPTLASQTSSDETMTP